MQINGVEMHVAVQTKGIGSNVKVREYGHGGLVYVEGRPEQPYSIVLKNNTAGRLLFVVSVDGLDVVTGQPATLESDGYVLHPFSSIEIAGWRVSMEAVNKFVFKTKTGSYASATQGSVANCGVIACRVFEEIVPKPRFDGMLRSFGSTIDSDEKSANFEQYSGKSVAAASAGATYSSVVSDQPADFNLGTGWGTEQKSVVRTTVFRKGSQLAAMDLYYTDAASLERVGVVLDKHASIALPQGFGGFCKPPQSTT